MCAIGMIAPVCVSAAEVDTVTLPLEVYGPDVISVALPSIIEEEGSPFDFILDPQQLIYETDAAKYGGGRVEEGATLLFRNHGDDYDFSRFSDTLSVRNQSNVPVVVTITARVSDLDGIDMLSSPDFSGDSCSIYLAIVDSGGYETPITDNGEITFSVEMRCAPENAYIYRIDEETGEYSYEFSGDPDSIDFDTFSFGLTGFCNPEGNWEDISVHPTVTVTWSVDPVMSEVLEQEPEQQTPEEQTEEPEQQTLEEQTSEQETQEQQIQEPEAVEQETSETEKTSEQTSEQEAPEQQEPEQQQPEQTPKQNAEENKDAS